MKEIIEIDEFTTIINGKVEFNTEFYRYDLSQFEVQEYIKTINNKIQILNRKRCSRTKIELLNRENSIRLYWKKHRRMEIATFRKQHGCLDCWLFEKPRECRGMDICPIEKDIIQTFNKKEKFRCPMDKVGNCNYGKILGYCLNGCLQKIMKRNGY